MPLAVNDIVEVTAKMAFNGSSAVRNVFHFKCTVASSVDDLTIAEGIGLQMDVMYGSVKGIMPDNLTAETIQVVNLTGNRIMGEVPWGAYFPGGISTANAYATGVACVLRLLTASRGVQGRKFIGSLSESAIGDDALLDDAAIEACLEFGGALLSEWTVEGGHILPVVYNRLTHVARAITGLILSAVPGYQRRRKVGLGI